jgi:hypothetical protein
MTTLTQPLATNKVIERIRALLAMGGDTSSIHEAAIATKRANKMMADHQINLSDIKNLSGANLGCYQYDLNSNQQKTWLSALALKIAKMNDCIVSFASRASTSSLITYEFKGFEEDVAVCEFMMVYLVDACNELYERDSSKLRLSGVADKHDYLLGLSDKINERIQTIMNERAAAVCNQPSSNALVIDKSIIVEQAHGSQQQQSTVESRKPNYRAFSAGKMAAKDVHLGRFIGNDYQKPNHLIQ